MLGRELVVSEGIIDIPDEDVEELHDDDVITNDEARTAVRDRDHQIAVNTAQELIRQRGILFEDLEAALNLCRRYRGILADVALPDPCAAKLQLLLKKYGMEGVRGGASPKRDWTAEDQERIAALTVGLKQALPPAETLGLPTGG